MMKAVEVRGTKAKPEVTLNPAVPKPSPKNGEILIKVHAAGVTGDEITWWELWEHPIRIPGHDISGEVAALGPDYQGDLKVGDEVYSMIHGWRGLGQAEYAIVESAEVARKPGILNHAQASALPIPLLTAWEAIFERAHVQKGWKVLVTGASGAVGVILVQMASRLAGAEVFALASSQHHDSLKALGASQVVDYNMPRWEDSIRDMDVVIDTVGNPVLAKTWMTVKSNGHIITVGQPPAAWEYGKGRPEELDEFPNVKWLFFVVVPKTETLEKAARLVDEGTIKPIAIEVFPLDKAAQAHKHASIRNRKGKVVIEFVPEKN
ncbi:NAD(P)-binding protein [Trichoderma ceciliae]